MTSLFRLLCTAVFAILCAANAVAQTGKVVGTVTDADTGNPLPGVNVVIVGTQQGATTNAEGSYTILNVEPGNYDVRASFVGFAPVTQQGVNINIDLTTEVNFALQEQTEELEEVTVQAEEPVVKRDISANVANMSAEDIENMPVMSVEDVVGLQAGVGPGLSVRGSSLNEVSYMVDGMTMRQGRTNEPLTNVSLTAVKEVRVQTGGFNAEYGNVRSGLVNIVTKEGPRDHYTADVIMRYSPPQEEYFGNPPNHPDGYWMRPFVDDPDIPNESDPAFVGTDSDETAWDEWTRRQYPQFQGWDEVVKEWAENDNPNDDLTIDQAQELFDWHHRKSLDITTPDYEIDAGMGGPVPAIGQALGDLRFFLSYRQTQDAYFLPSQRDAYTDRVARLKVTSDIGRSMKLELQGMYSGEHGIQPSGTGFPNMWRGNVPKYPWRSSGMSANASGGNSGGGAEIFANHTDNPSDIYHNSVGAEFTHTLGANTFYEVRLQRMHSDYNTVLPRIRNVDSVATTIGPMEVNEAPNGWFKENVYSPSNMALGGHWGKARDSSTVGVWTGRFDMTSQLNRSMQAKAGLEYILSNYHVRHGQYELFFTSNTAPKFRWDRQPRQGAAYAQSKFEFEGMVANLGVRLDYWYPGGTWYNFDPYDLAFSPRFGKDSLDAVLDRVPTERQFFLSPRLGVSFPVTESSKFFFNYGHFRQMLNPHQLFVLRTINTGAIDRVGNPNHPMPRTVAYEMGYEQGLFDQFLIRASGYYKALDRQSRSVRYISLDGLTDYQRYEPLDYEDIRGAEITLRKNKGRYVRGFVNYTYMAVKRGDFGFGRSYENRAQQRQFERDSRAHYQNRPVAQPYSRFNIEFLGPRQLGPSWGGVRPLGDWRLSFLGEWKAGQVFTWSGSSSIQGLENNVRWSDYYNLDLRLAKNFGAVLQRAQLFIDVTNILNIRHLRRSGAFSDQYDRLSYMESLHLPEDTFGDEEAPYPFIPGDDRPGDYREPGVEYQPVEIVDNVEDVKTPHPRPFYYERSSQRYMTFVEGSWTQVDNEKLEQVLEAKAYIDMPNYEYLRFFNPRRVRFGLRVSF